MPSSQVLLNSKRFSGSPRYDLDQLPYSPTIWQRIGGPWSITLRAYLWTAPLAIFLQPLVESSFWNDFGTLPYWLINATLAHLVFGMMLWLGKYLFTGKRNKFTSSAGLVISIAIVASMARSTVIGLLIEPLGLTGFNWLVRLPFGIFLGFAWIFTSALIMDSKYRFRLHLESLVSEQIRLLNDSQEWIDQVRKTLSDASKEQADTAHRNLQQAMREIAISSNNPQSIWSNVTEEIKRTSIRIALADVKDKWTSATNLSELQGSRSKAFTAITRTPLMDVPLVIVFTVTIMFLATTRLYPLGFALSVVAYGAVLQTLIILASQFLIKRQTNPSSFGYFIMLALLFVSGLVSSTLVAATDVNMITFRSLIVAAIGVEIVWLVASGYIQYAQIQRQLIIDNAKLENDRLRLTLAFWHSSKDAFESKECFGYGLMQCIADSMKHAFANDDLMQGLQAMEFASLYFAEFSEEFLGADAMTIENELNRISHTWNTQAEIIWSISGPQVDSVIARRAIAAIEICVSKSIRHGNASVVSVDVRSLENQVEIKVSDNGTAHNDNGSGLGVEILQALSHNTWQRYRSGGINIATAKFC